MKINKTKKKILDILEDKYTHYFEFFIQGEDGHSQFFSVKSKKKELTGTDEIEMLK